MAHLDRRGFLGASLGALAAGGALGGGASRAFADEAPPQDVPASLFLTWQGDPTTTITIQWIGPEDEALDDVRFGRHDKELSGRATASVRPFPDTDLKVHRCELTGLEPGAEYDFSLGENGAPRRFRTMPAKANDVIQFVSGGDSGTGSHAIATTRLAARQEPYFALIGGDLAYDDGDSPETFRRFLENYGRNMIDPRGRLVPMISCLGNHEVQGGYNAPREKGAAYFSVFDGFFAERTYGAFDVGDYLSLVLLDTNHVSKAGGEQTDWLRETLAARQERPHLIVANHVPAYPSYRDPWGEPGEAGTGADNRKHWCPLFERYNVDVVLEHHDHTFKRTFPLKDGLIDANGIVYLGDGSWGKIRSPQPAEKRAYLARTSRAFHLTVHRLEGDRRFHVALEETGKVADVCMTESKRPSKG